MDDSVLVKERRADAPTPEVVSRQLDRYHAGHDQQLRNQLVEEHLGLAEFHASRFASSVASFEDLRQVACLGMIGAVERFDPTLGVSFRTFASRTIEGECKRYLRDRTWAVRPPRRSQERYLVIRRVQEELTHRLGRPPLVGELAREIG